MELRFNVILYSKLGNGNADASRIKCSRGPQVPHPCSVPVSQPFPATEFHSFVKKSGADLESQFSIFCNFPVRVLIDSNTKNSFGSISSVPTGNMLLLVVCSFVKPAAVIARSASHTCACCNAVLNQCCRSPMM